MFQSSLCPKRQINQHRLPQRPLTSKHPPQPSMAHPLFSTHLSHFFRIEPKPPVAHPTQPKPVSLIFFHLSHMISTLCLSLSPSYLSVSLSLCLYRCFARLCLVQSVKSFSQVKGLSRNIWKLFTNKLLSQLGRHLSKALVLLSRVSRCTRQGTNPLHSLPNNSTSINSTKGSSSSRSSSRLLVDNLKVCNN
jgi:hypothetical protein